MGINEERNHIANATDLLQILHSYAPTIKEQEICSQMVRNAQSEGITGRELVIMLSSSIRDGLKYGNWPWDLQISGI